MQLYKKVKYYNKILKSYLKSMVSLDNFLNIIEIIYLNSISFWDVYKKGLENEFHTHMIVLIIFEKSRIKFWGQ
jgi:hypothetical protein